MLQKNSLSSNLQSFQLQSANLEYNDSQLTLSNNLDSSLNYLPQAAGPLHRLMSEEPKNRMDYRHNQSKLLVNKFKRFYQAQHQNQLNNVVNEKKINQQWQNFQRALNNPFEFDNLIDKVRKQVRQNQQFVSKQSKRKLKVQKKKTKSVENQKMKKLKKNCYSLQKRKNTKVLKNLMKQQIKQIVSILNHGQKFIKLDQFK